VEKLIRLVVVFFVFCFFFVTTGCATIIHGSDQVLELQSVPSGATVRVSNGMVFTTPSSTKLKRNQDYILTFSKEGYQTQVIPVNSVLSGWVAGNIILGGIIGGGVDLATGAAYTLTPSEFTITLTPLSSGQVASDSTPGVMSTQQKLDALENLHDQGIMNDKEYEASKAKLNQDLKKELMAD